MPGGKHILGKQNSKRVFGTARVGDRGQIVIPKEARELFGFQPGQTILVLADEKRGIAIPPRAESEKHMKQLIEALQKEDE